MTGTRIAADATAGARRQVRAAAGPGARAWLRALFAVYLALLVWIVVWKLGVPHVGDGADRVVKLVPFARTAESGASAPREVLANLVLFVPFGVYLRLLAPARAWWRHAAVAALASLALEAAQYVLAVGRSDVTDVLVNAAGGALGVGLAVAARRAGGHGAVVALTRLCAAGTAIALVVVALFVVPRA